MSYKWQKLQFRCSTRSLIWRKKQTRKKFKVCIKIENKPNTAVGMCFKISIKEIPKRVVWYQKAGIILLQFFCELQKYLKLRGKVQNICQFIFCNFVKNKLSIVDIILLSTTVCDQLNYFFMGLSRFSSLAPMLQRNWLSATSEFLTSPSQSHR